MVSGPTCVALARAVAVCVAGCDRAGPSGAAAVALCVLSMFAWSLFRLFMRLLRARLRELVSVGAQRSIVVRRAW